MVQQIQVSSVLVKPVSADCNLACSYCFYSSKSVLYPDDKVHIMKDDVLMEFIAQFLTSCGDQVLFSWQGGEPLLAGLEFYKKVLWYQSLFGMPNQIISNSIQTNGTLIDNDWAKFFAKHGFLVGVSLDGPSNIHDRYRVGHDGAPSFEKVMRGIDCLRQNNVDFNILCLLNNNNIKHPKELFHFFVERGFNYLQFIPCVEVNPKDGNVEDFSITPAQYGRFLCSVFDEWTKDEIPLIYIRDFEDLLISYVTGESPSCVYSGECGDYIVVEHNGDVYPCDFFVEEEWVLGNLVAQPMDSLLNGKFLYFRQRKQRITQNCRECTWFARCRGGCPKNWEPSGVEKNYFCSSYKTFFEHSDEEFNRLKQFVENRFSRINQ